MRKPLKIRAALLSLILYLVFCVVGGILVADGALHPLRRPLTDTDVSAVKNSLEARGGTLDDVSLTARDGAVLRAWVVHPHLANGDAAILLHGLGDNRLGMMGYAQLLTAHGYTLLLPDARAHGISGGNLATYGLLERNDIRGWLQIPGSSGASPLHLRIRGIHGRGGVIAVLADRCTLLRRRRGIIIR
jgi:uncharacterized protein